MLKNGVGVGFRAEVDVLTQIFLTWKELYIWGQQGTHAMPAVPGAVALSPSHTHTHMPLSPVSLSSSLSLSRSLSLSFSLSLSLSLTAL